ncbi:hypothetical protein MVA48_21985 [Blastococcus sp. PRF04-17]|nr:penicillin-binding transpeptidase domain-containing protein [Blastococcus sp. PRF04-17]UOY01564.1 hypothetical protein MVA48_21985 [Blastococcus sp. PRF04-17]
MVRPGTGEILAVSSNEAADASLALAGRFPPGSSMKMITATALLATGDYTPDTPLPCPGTIVVDGREFENQDRFDLGVVPFRETFAQSCNTTFIEQALTLPGSALADTAAAYGVGTDWQLPVDVFSGSVPADSTGTTRAANAIGQGEVLMSPAQMALVAGAIASGTPAAPVEVLDAEAAGPTPSGPAAPVLEALRTMMRQVVLTGTAQALAPGARSSARRAPRSTAATCHPTRTAGSWATSSAGRRVTSPSRCWSRAVSPAASPSASPTPSSPDWADSQAPRSHGRRRRPVVARV